MADPKRVAPSTLPQTTERSPVELRVQKWWEALVTLQSSLPACFATPHLQCGRRITSLKLVAGVGVAPTKAELMRLA